MSKATIFVANGNDVDAVRGTAYSAPWIEIKEIMLRNFLPEEYIRMINVKEQLQKIEETKS